MDKNTRPDCCANVLRNTGVWGSSRCSRKGTICHEGKWYCKQHDPVAVNKRTAASTAKYMAERKQKQEQRDRRDAECRACEGVPTRKLTRGLVGYLLGMEANDG